MLDYYHGGYDYRIPKPGLFFENGHFAVNLQFPGMDLRYTMDGKDPDSKQYRIYQSGSGSREDIKIQGL